MSWRTWCAGATALAALAATGPGVRAEDSAAAPAPTTAVASAGELPAGLETFLRACLLEAAGAYREALAEYRRALDEAPDVTEVKVRYASLLVELGLVDTAVNVLAQAGELDWYGLRTRGLALAQLATHRPELLAEAEKTLRAAVEIRTDDPNLELSLAQVLQRMGRLDEAESLIAALRSARPGSVQLVAYHANLLRALGRLEAAAAAFRECLPAPGCRSDLVAVLLELERPAEAGQTLLEGLADDDLDELLRAASLLSDGGRQADALAAVQRVLRREPGSVRARTLEALILTDMGRAAEASAALEQLLREDRGNLELTLALAWNVARAGRLEEARRLLDRAWAQVEQSPDSARAVACGMAAARVELVAGHPRVAREWLDRVTDPSAAGADYVRLLGACIRRTEEWADGVAAVLRLEPLLKGPARSEAVALEAELRIRQGDPRGTERLATLLESSSEADVLAALAVLQVTERWSDVDRHAAAALERFPGQRDIRFTRAAALERLGSAEEAERLFGELVGDDPDDAAAANYLGYMLADRGVRLEEALRLVTRAVELEPGNAAYLDSLGWVQFRLGNLEAAETWLRRSLAIGDRDGTVVAHLGEVLAARGQREEAKTLLRQALDLGCDRPEDVRALLDGLGD